MEIIRAEDLHKPFNLAIVVSRFNEDITKALLDGAVERLRELEFSDENITVTWVPGAVELPIVAQRFAKREDIQAVICLGAVIRGETTHYDYVCSQASDGCQRVALEQDKPIIFGVLTTENKAQAIDRIGGAHGHKGRDAADCAYEMVSILSQL